MLCEGIFILKYHTKSELFFVSLSEINNSVFEYNISFWDNGCVGNTQRLFCSKKLVLNASIN